jgi:hypothetical protein
LAIELKETANCNGNSKKIDKQRRINKKEMREKLERETVGRGGSPRVGADRKKGFFSSP